MTLMISQVTVDCHDPQKIGAFWIEAMGWAEDPDDPNLPGDDMFSLMSPDGSQTILFIMVPEAKAVKNRLHLDIAPVDSTRDIEVERLLAAGASLYDDQRRPDGTGWVVLQDPEGNEFCILRSNAERGIGDN